MSDIRKKSRKCKLIPRTEDNATEDDDSDSIPEMTEKKEKLNNWEIVSLTDEIAEKVEAENCIEPDNDTTEIKDDWCAEDKTEEPDVDESKNTALTYFIRKDYTKEEYFTRNLWRLKYFCCLCDKLIKASMRVDKEFLIHFKEHTESPLSITIISKTRREIWFSITHKTNEVNYDLVVNNMIYHSENKYQFYDNKIDLHYKCYDHKEAFEYYSDYLQHLNTEHTSNLDELKFFEELNHTTWYISYASDGVPKTFKDFKLKAKIESTEPIDKTCFVTFCPICCVEVESGHMLKMHSVRSDYIMADDLEVCDNCKGLYIHFYRYLHICPDEIDICQCKHCGFGFRNTFFLKMHRRLFRNGYVCKQCKSYFNYSCMFREHLLQCVESNNVLVYRCNFCNKNYRSVEEVRSHVTHHHKLYHLVIHYTKNIILESSLKNMDSELKVIGPTPLKKVKNKETKPKETKTKETKPKEVGPKELRQKETIELPKPTFKTYSNPRRKKDDIHTVTEESTDSSTKLIAKIGDPRKKIEIINVYSKNNQQDSTNRQFYIEGSSYNGYNLYANMPNRYSAKRRRNKCNDTYLEYTNSEAFLENADDSVEESDESRIQIKKEKESVKDTGLICVKKEFNVSNDEVERITIKEEPIEVTHNEINFSSEIKKEVEEISLNEDTSQNIDEFIESNLEINIQSADNVLEDVVSIINENYRFQDGNIVIKEEIESDEEVTPKKKKVKKALNVSEELMFSKDVRTITSKTGDIDEFKCTKCDKSYENFVEYSIHFISHGFKNDDIFICPICDNFSSDLSFPMHMMKHLQKNYVKGHVFSENGQTCGTYCCQCRSEIDTPDFFPHWESHIDISKKDKLDPEAKYFHDVFLGVRFTNDNICELCFKRFQRRISLKIHLIEHLCSNAKRKFVGHHEIPCNLCHEVFVNINIYKEHLIKHASITFYECQICNKAFSESSNYSKHIKTHGYGIYICDDCNRRFRSKEMFIKHLSQHSNVIECEVCQQKFHLQSQFNRHMKKHDKNKIYRCQFCKSVCNSSKTKWEHEWLVHKYRKAVNDCGICNLKFRKFQELKRHMESKHDINLPKVKDMNMK